MVDSDQSNPKVKLHYPQKASPRQDLDRMIELL